MQKTYVTFGLEHKHVVHGRTFNSQYVGIIYADTPEQGRALAFAYFGDKFCMEYPEAYWDSSVMDRHYKGGYLEVNACPVIER